MKFIPKQELEELFSKYKGKDILQIAQGTSKSLILVIDDTKIEKVKKSIILQNLQSDLYKLVLAHTDEKISGPEDIKIFIERKEDFAVKYGGSWYNYFRWFNTFKYIE